MTNLILFVIFIVHIYSRIYKASFHIFFSFAGGQAPQAPSGYASDIEDTLSGLGLILK